MKIIAINGSPRKKWNTDILLNKALEGAASQGAETELIHLYDLNYKGCISCFACEAELLLPSMSQSYQLEIDNYYGKKSY
ncbi:hypothetical protein SBF1_5670010 [Candidatus Desulfosporosinus infrequens]|uniref:NADPH-dependent FMN reductase-like domain-containing protein n=1 Tax=Candidatus Desulfosporosinus infrequens TaxID=2043169 RepID=A0A2U3LKL6_9FIRM|nr:hypothetical protein SBF1_5670010 [Candidatus Desulfosporosinus infrequens]